MPVSRTPPQSAMTELIGQAARLLRGKKPPVVARVGIRWADMDSYGHVNNTRFIQAMEEARIAYFSALGRRAPEQFPDYILARAVGPILASTSCTFVRPVAYPDTLLVSAGAPDGLSADGTVFELEHLLVSAETGGVVGKGTGKVVMVDYRNGGKRASMPEPLAEALRSVEAEASTMVDWPEELRALAQGDESARAKL